ncbi:hypothetical protein M422DRAFT_266863 [Sphaerobolus stellatus SS14]|uniref:Uncharacterized protein n=1 Tax=Sphaerobolus stellatus (strain SS14) TaxID=990650 RepID=A0A0C9V1Y8_SPHS4|nr:hypothetical protein M422DRAFT_266863 [Sphaerobolus stellatus SS14]
MAALGCGKGTGLACSLRKWVWDYLEDNDNLPINIYHGSVSRIAEDEDLAQEIHEHLRGLGKKYLTAMDVVWFLGTSEIKEHFKLQKLPSERTVHHWLHAMEYRYKKPSKDLGWLKSKDSTREARILFKAGKNREGYFSNEDLCAQTELAIELFEDNFPGTAVALFAFDNVPSHQKRAADGLSSLKMPKFPKLWAGHDGKTKMRNGMLPNVTLRNPSLGSARNTMPGYFKGMSKILEECGFIEEAQLPASCAKFKCNDPKASCCCQRILFNQPDFVAQKSALVELIEDSNHLVIFYPKFHCELNFIEQCWGASKYDYQRSLLTKNEAQMDTNIWQCLDNVNIVKIRRFANRSARFMDGYQQGLTGSQASWANKKYHGHRVLPESIMNELENAKIQAKHNENCIEVGTVSGACFVYHPKGCKRCSTYVEHLLADIDQRPAKFSFPRDEILDQIHEAWPHVKKANNCQLGNDLDDLKERIQELETQLSSLQTSNTVSECSMTLTSPTNYNPAVGSAHLLESPAKVTYSRKCSRKLDENADFRNHVLKFEVQPDHWSLHMWQALLGWHKNPKSVPNAIRDNPDGYFLKEDIDVAAWLNKIIADNSRPAFMNRMKTVFGSHLTFETIFSEFDSNLLRPECQQMCWITDSSMPVRIGFQITKGTKDKAQTTEPVCLPQGAEFLALLLKHCSLSREQIYTHIIPYMERDEEKRPMSAAAMDAPAPNKGKKPLTGSSQSKPTAHALQPAKLRQSSHQRLDANLEAYNNEREPILPYSGEPPSHEPDVEMHGPTAIGACGTLTEESTINVDPEIEDLYE